MVAALTNRQRATPSGGGRPLPAARLCTDEVDRQNRCAPERRR